VIEFLPLKGYKMQSEFLKEPSFVALEKRAFDAIQRIFPCETELLDKVPLDGIVDRRKGNLKSVSSPLLVRISGQSGSGKSSQLAPAIEKILKDIPYAKINVGSFAEFHPRFAEWQKNSPDKMRENTNGFALRALVLFYKHCILNRVNIVLDMTLLEPEIDLYLMTLAKKAGYKIQTHVLCVPKLISDTFIRRRQQQTGRYVKPSSSSYFFKALAPCLKALTKSGLFNQNDRLVLWSHTQTHPIQQTHLNNRSVLRKLNHYQERKNAAIKNPKALLKAKIRWINLICEGFLNHV